MNNNIGYNNKAWGRSNQNSSNLMNQNQLQSQPTGIGNMVPFPGNQPLFQNAMGLQQQNLGLGLQQIHNAITAPGPLGSQVANNPIFQQVSYPNRGLNPKAFQSNMSLQNNQNNGSGRQRVFTGKVTQMHDNFGLVDEEVVFQMNVCVMGSRPTVGDRVLVEAQNTPNMPFKWNATRIQVITGSQSRSYGNSNYVPQSDRRRRDGKGRDRSRDRDRDDDEVDRKRRREDRVRERERDDRKSPLRKRSKSRSRSPKGVRRRPRIIPRYMVQIPKINLDLDSGDVLEIKRRYKNMYIPSDFFFTSIKWVDSFPADKPFAINKPCSFHVMHKDVEPIIENGSSDPPDADYLFSAKVMLMSTPGLEEIYHRCCALAEDKDNDEKDYVHPTRLIDFLIGLRGKNETMAIGGAWSPSLDGENPKEDPTVLIRTAIRTCKSLTGIDLSNCTQWYRFLELYYRRSESTYKGKTVPARVETVVLFLPDVWSCLPTRVEWDDLQNSYKKQCERILTQPETAAVDADDGAGAAESGGSGDPASRIADSSGDQSSPADEKEDEESSDKLEPTHHSQLDPKAMVVNDLRTELTARGLSAKGLKSQLVARLMKALASEAEKSEAKEKETKEVESESETSVVEVKKEVEEKKMDDKEKALLERRHTLPEHPQIIVHPSKTAKSGKFECTTMSLSLLLDYRPEDSKEHSFEVSLFAELFNEMLSRDFGFNIYKSLFELPEKKEEKKDKKESEGKEEKKDEKAEVKEGGDSEEKATNLEEAGDTAEKKEDDKKDKTSNGDKKKEESDDDSEKRKERERKKKEKIKLYTKDKHLLLSFVYFDQTQCGYIFDKDVEDLIYTLGLKQSRAQIKKMISKVIVRDSLHYRKLTDKPKNAEDESAEEPPKELDLAEIAQGNKKLLPVFGAKESNEKVSKRRTTGALETTDGFVKFRGSVVDVGKLLNQLERSEQVRVDTEARMIDLKNENQKLTEKYHKSNSTIKQLTSELRENKDKLRNANDVLSKTNTHSKLYYQTLLDIKDKIDPILRTSHKEETKKERDEKDRDRKQDDGKSRWEKDKDHAHSKKEEKEEVKKEKEKEKESEKEKEDGDVEMVEAKKEKD